MEEAKLMSEESWMIYDKSNSKNFIQFNLLDHDIIILKASGYITEELFTKASEQTHKIRNAQLKYNDKVFLIIDASKVVFISMSIRSRFVFEFKRDERYYHFTFFVGMNPFLKILLVTHEEYLSDNSIIKIMKKTEDALSFIRGRDHKKQLEYKTGFKINHIETNSLWNHKSHTHFFEFETKIINRNIIYRETKGEGREDDIDFVIECSNRSISYVKSKNTRIYVIDNVLNLKKISRVHRKKFVRWINNIGNDVESWIFVHTNIILKTMVMMFIKVVKNNLKIQVVDDDKQAFTIIYDSIFGDKSEVKKADVSKDKLDIIRVHQKNRILELMNIIGHISWNPTAEFPKLKISESDDFYMLFRGIEMLHGDILSMITEIEHHKNHLQDLVNESTKMLQQQNDELKLLNKKSEEASILKTAFLANMSHEIRTPMNAIIGFSKMLQDKDTSEELKKEYVTNIVNGSNHLLSLISDIMDISKIESGEISIFERPTDLHYLVTVVMSSVKIFLKEKNKENIELKTNLDKAYRYVYVDDTRLKQVLLNLLYNAVKFTTKGEINFGYKRKNSEIEFYVKDTGIGIEKEQITKIFERFEQGDNEYTRKYGGSGLGLSISRALVRLMGGEINVESELGVGSKFLFTIPYNESKETECPKKDIDIFSNFQDKKILVAEDDELNFKVISALLRPTKAQIIRAKNGQEAVDIFDKNRDISLILMDIQMPIKNGLDATQDILKINKNIPIVAQTANAFSDDRKRAISYGCVDYISKPIKQEDIISIVSKHIL